MGAVLTETPECHLVVTQLCDGAPCAAPATTQDVLGAIPPLGPTTMETCGGGFCYTAGTPATKPSFNYGTCTGAQKTVQATQQTVGYGGIWDKLSIVDKEATYKWSCSGGSGNIIGTQSRCTWAAWNGWYNDGCYDYWSKPSSDSDLAGTTGFFHCVNNNFCSSQHYYHYLDTAIRAFNNGDSWCVYSWGGTMPPSRLQNCYYV